MCDMGFSVRPKCRVVTVGVGVGGALCGGAVRPVIHRSLNHFSMYTRTLMGTGRRGRLPHRVVDIYSGHTVVCQPPVLGRT